MYWTFNPEQIPDPTWDRLTVAEHLAPFEDALALHPDEQVRTYCRYYGLDLKVDHPKVKHRVGYLLMAGYRVAIHRYTQPQSRGTAFLFHGFFDHAGLYSRLVEHCLEEGLDVLIYDLPGHGLSSGPVASIGGFSEYQQVLEEVMAHFRGKLQRPWVAAGQSTGAGVLVDYLLSNARGHDSSEFQAVALMAPLVRPVGFGAGQYVHQLVSPFLKTWRRAFVTNSNDESFLKFQQSVDPLQAQVLSLDWIGALRSWVRRIENMPPVPFDVTVIQGEQDFTVAWRHNLRVLRRKFRSVKLYQIPEGHHHLVNEAEPILEQVFGAVSDCFNRQLPPRS